MEGYSVKIKEASRELSGKERVALKITDDCIKLDEATQEAPVLIDVSMYAILEVHNEKSDNKDYSVYVIVDQNGARYVTGSMSFFNSFMGIYEEMEGEEEDYAIKVYRSPSKNFKGKDFLTCTIV